MSSVSVGVSWKREERDEVEEAAALLRIWGKGEAERKEGSAALRELVDIGDDVMGETTGHVVVNTSRDRGRKGDVGFRRQKVNRRSPKFDVGPATDHRCGDASHLAVKFDFQVQRKMYS